MRAAPSSLGSRVCQCWATLPWAKAACPQGEARASSQAVCNCDLAREESSSRDLAQLELCDWERLEKWGEGSHEDGGQVLEFWEMSLGLIEISPSLCLSVCLSA